jgi:hypothetical protein
MSFPEHGHGEGASVVGCAREALKLVLRVLAYVGDVDDAAGQDGAMGGATPAWRRRVRITISGGALRGHVMKSSDVDEPSVKPEDGSQLGAAEAVGTGRDGLEHRLGIGRRARDHTQDLAGRRLLLQGVGQGLLQSLALAGLLIAECRLPLERLLQRLDPRK